MPPVPVPGRVVGYCLSALSVTAVAVAVLPERVATTVTSPTTTTASTTTPMTFLADQCGRSSTWVGTSTCRAPGGKGVPQVSGSRVSWLPCCPVSSVPTVLILLLVLTPADSLQHEPVR